MTTMHTQATADPGTDLGGRPDYLLGHADAEVRRLEEQGRILAPATSALLSVAGILPGMRVLDLGTGAGDVAFLAAGRVGPSGSVVGIDSAPRAIETARARADRARIGNVSFRCGDVRDLDPATDLEGRFDAVIGRLVLLYVDDQAGVVRRWAGALRPGGVYLAMEYDMTACRNLPRLPLTERLGEVLLAAFRTTGHDPVLGTRLRDVLADAGLVGPVCLGIQAYLAADDAAGPRLLAETLRTLMPAITGHGIATADEIGIDTLEQRILADQQAAGAILTPPTLVGAWGRTPDGATPPRARRSGRRAGATGSS